MSHQLNFIADTIDLDGFHSYLKTTLHDWSVIGKEWGRPDELIPQSIAAFAFPPSDKVMLIAPYRNPVRLWHRADGVARVEIEFCPIIEYSMPSVDGRTGKTGRIYFCCRKTRFPRVHKDGLRVIRWLRDKSVAIPGAEPFRVLPSARRTLAEFEYWVGIRNPNPFLNDNKQQ